MSATSQFITRILLRHPVAGGLVVIAVGLLTMWKELQRSQPQTYMPIAIMVFGAIILLFGKRIAVLLQEHLE